MTYEEFAALTLQQLEERTGVHAPYWCKVFGGGAENWGIKFISKASIGLGISEGTLFVYVRARQSQRQAKQSKKVA